MRHHIVTQNDPERGVSVSTLARDYPPGSHVPTHAHGSHQLVYAGSGVMQVFSDRRFWLVPPQFGLWVPARVEHEIRMPKAVSMRTLYMRPGLIAFGSCKALHVRPLLRELVFEIVRVGRLRNGNRLECALCDVLVAELNQARPVPTEAAMPADARAVRVAQTVVDSLEAAMTLPSLCASAGISVRILQRIFCREAGMDFETWRRQVRLMKAVELLVSGSSVKEAAYAVGYQAPSPLVSLFKSTFGTTPRAWTASLTGPLSRQNNLSSR